MSDKFEQWWDGVVAIPSEEKAFARFVWDAALSNLQCEQEAKIAELESKLAEVEKDAELGRLVMSKMKSGNDVPVSRCTITADEIAAIQESKKGGAV